MKYATAIQSSTLPLLAAWISNWRPSGNAAQNIMVFARSMSCH